MTINRNRCHYNRSARFRIAESAAIVRGRVFADRHAMQTRLQRLVFDVSMAVGVPADRPEKPVLNFGIPVLWLVRYDKMGNQFKRGFKF